MKPLSVCLCTTFFPPHGNDHDARYVFTLANALAGRGHRVTVVHHPGAARLPGRRSRPAEVPLNPAVEKVQINGPAGAAGLLALHQFGRPLGLAHQLDAVLHRPFDVIHFHNVSLMGGPALFSLGADTLRIATLNDHWLVCPTHLLWTADNGRCETPRCLSCCLRQRRPPQLWRSTGLLSRALGHVDALIGPSRLTIDVHRARGVDRPMIHLPGLCTESPVDADDELPDTIPEQFFLAIGKLEVHKGFEGLIEQFRTMPDHHLVVHGSGRLYRRIERGIDRTSNVHLVPEGSRARLSALLRRAIATVVPTRAWQTFCHATAASFAHGVPVVGIDGGAAAEIVSWLGGGLLYRDGRSLSRALDILSAGSGERARLATKAAAGAREFSEAVYVDRYVDMVRELAERRAAHGEARPFGGNDTTIANLAVRWT